MIGGHAVKVKVFHPDYNEHREVVMKTVKDGQAAITRGSPRVMCDLRMEEGTIWATVSLQSLVQLWFIILYLVHL